MEKIFSSEQVAAINTFEKNVILIAGAGSGKTTVLISRIRKLLKDGVLPKDILAITFTKKAAQEMSKRLDNSDVLVMTFDAFCYKIIDNKNINILNDSSFFTRKEMLSFNLYDSNFRKIKKPDRYDEYNCYKKTNGLKDFNDLEYMAIEKIMINHITFKYIMIDEFQDTNYLQYEMLKALNKNSHTFLVGDPDQSIYGFRGSLDNIIEKYIKDFKAKILFLTNNYRSNREIVKKANRLISFNEDRIFKDLKAKKGKSGIIEYAFYNNEKDEFNETILIYEGIKEKYKSIAILYRNNEQGYYYKKYFFGKYDNINVLTIHEAKGLEFDFVFLIGVNKGIFPANYYNTNKELEEERRLMFVAITRAKDVILISSNTRKSRFIKELRIKGVESFEHF